MEKGKTILLILFLITLFIAIFLAIRISILTQEQDKAKTVNEEILAFFYNNDIRCKATSDEPGKILTCINDLNRKFSTSFVDEAGFKNVDVRSGKEGYVIVKNKILRSLNSTDFTLLKDNTLVDSGCEISGVIDKEETCKLFFSEYCEPGQFLEVMYQDTRVFIRNC
ncbi:MAG: hypothetical protein ABIJ21_06285 [Nanoarchaeota archaeon]